MQKAILQYGRILSVQNLMSVFQEEYAKTSAHNRIHVLSRTGWLRRIKQGLYLIIDSLTARGDVDVSLLSIANALRGDSYVSFAHALNHYQLFDQYNTSVISVTLQESKKYLFDGHTFVYSKVKQGMYFGFTEKMIDGKMVRLAEAEKALIDYLYLDRSFSSISLVFEIIKDHAHDLDLKKLQEYAQRGGITMARKIGFMLDAAGLDATFLHQAVGNNRSASRCTVESKVFNARWRLYYDQRIIG